MKTKQLIFGLMIVLVSACAGIEQQNEAHTYTLKIKGSESMHETFDALKEEFEAKQDSIKLSIEGGGSRTGLEAIKEGSADIGLSSYDFDLDQELGYNHGVYEKVVAYDGIVLINHRDNPLQQLTNEQIQGIYKGKYSDWSELGGNPGPIVPIVRDSNSGTQKFFLDYFEIDNVNPVAVVAGENHDIVMRVRDNANSIGFIGFGYFTETIKNIEIPSGPNSDTAFSSATFKNLGEGHYPLKRSLMMYYKNGKNPAIKGFLSYLGSKEAQMLIKEHGLMPKQIQDSVNQLSAGVY